MKLSAGEIIILVVGVMVVAPILVALVTPSPDAITMLILWLLAASVFVGAFFGVKWLVRKKP